MKDRGKERGRSQVRVGGVREKREAEEGAKGGTDERQIIGERVAFVWSHGLSGQSEPTGEVGL